MRPTVRAITIAIAIIWLFIIATIGTAIYSAANIRVFLNSTETTISPDGSIILTVNFTIQNNWFEDLRNLNIITSILEDSRDILLSFNTTMIDSIGGGENITVIHSVSMNLFNLDNETLEILLFDDTALRFETSVGVTLAEVLPVRVGVSTKSYWGAPLYGFIAGPPTLKVVGGTNYASVLVSFENHSSLFPVIGTIKVSIYNSTGAFLGYGEASVSVPSYYDYSGYIDIPISNPAYLTENGTFSIQFAMNMFNFTWEVQY